MTDKIFWFTKDNILGGVAKWGIEQSPYDMPDNLEVALVKLNKIITPHFKPDEEFMSAEMTYREIQDFVMKSIEQVPEIVAWNEAKIKSNHPLIGSSSRYHRTKPDYDFIDLHALAHNVANDIVWNSDGGHTPIPMMLGENRLKAD